MNNQAASLNYFHPLILISIIFISSFPPLSFGQISIEPNYEITARRLHLRLFPSSRHIVCTDTLTIRKTADRVHEISLGLPRLYNVSSVTLSDRKANYQREGDVIKLLSVPGDAEFNLIVSYSGDLTFRSDFTGMSDDRAVLRDEETLVQGPKLLRFTRLSIVVPPDWEVISVGRLVERSSGFDSTLFVREFDQPLSTIGWICAGKYIRWQDTAGQQAISVYRSEKDTIAEEKIAAQARAALDYYSRKFSPYRFGEFSIVHVDDWVAGRNVLAVAAPSLIMIKDRAFETEDRFEQAATILPHEVAHQWWPLTVFIDQESLALLSEGLCEYSTLLFNESSGTMTGRDSLKTHPLLRPLLARATKKQEAPLQQRADLRFVPTQYLKASYVHNMLRRTIGDSLLLLLYRDFAQKFHTKNAGLADFQNLAEELTGKKLDWFFDEWVRKTGIPRLRIYNVKMEKTVAGWLTRGRVRIVGYEKFTTFADVGIETDAGIVKSRSWLGVDKAGNYRNDVPFEIITQERPRCALLDPDGDVLRMQNLPVKFGELREPHNGIMIIGTLQNEDYLLGLARQDSVQLDRMGWSIRTKRDVDVTLADLQRERIFFYGSPSENSVSADQQNRFPIKFRGDSVQVKDGAIFDSTLTLVELIENPYMAHGLICWIAPLSPKAQPMLKFLDASWAMMRGDEEISSGTWMVKDEDSIVDLR